MSTITQKIADLERFTVAINMAYKAIRAGLSVEDLPVYHLWFPVNKTIVDKEGVEWASKVELRTGNAPSDSQRPKHLRGLVLAVDPAGLPLQVLQQLRPDREFSQLVSKIARDRNLFYEGTHIYKPLPLY